MGSIAILKNNPNECGECRLFTICSKGQHGEGHCPLHKVFSIEDMLTPLSKIHIKKIVTHEEEEHGVL